jgi:uncharacterized membrane protein (UPF0127 family)
MMGKPGLLVTNVTRGTILADSLEIADTFAKSLMGLMGRSCLKKRQGLWIKPCQSIHTFWMRFPIDVLFLDKEGIVVHSTESMKPFRVSRHVSKARSVLELPVLSIRDSHTQLGDCIEVSNG